MERKVKLGLIQMSCGDTIEKNFNRTIDCVREVADKGAQIVCTQELFQTPYFCQTEDWRNFALAEEIEEASPKVQQLAALASELKIVLIASLFEKRTVGLYHNASIVFDADGSYLGKYRKMHIPNDPHYYEKFYFAPGDLGYKVFHTRYADIGVLICWDQWYPEAARLLALKGAEIIFIPTAIGASEPADDSDYEKSWQIVQQGHAVANACFLAVTNRVGFEPDPSIDPSATDKHQGGVGPDGESGIQFWGQSFIANPDGMIEKQASRTEEEKLVCEIDLNMIEDTRKRFSFPYRDRRVDSYEGLLELFSD